MVQDTFSCVRCGRFKVYCVRCRRYYCIACEAFHRCDG